MTSRRRPFPLRARLRVRTLLLLLVCGWLFVLHAGILLEHGLSGPEATVGDALLERAAGAGSANAVTTVVVSYRGFDTLGEVTVLFLAATGIGLLFAHRGAAKASAHDAGATAPSEAPSEMIATGVRLLFPVLLMFGVYVVVHGHLSPGGGFQGGVIIATAFVLRLLVEPDFHLHHTTVRLLESLSGSGFVLFGLLGLVIASTGTFLGNFLPHPADALGELVSGGVIPLIYVLVGIKVGAEVGVIFEDMLERRTEKET